MIFEPLEWCYPFSNNFFKSKKHSLMSLDSKKFPLIQRIVYYVPRRTMRVIAWRATMLAGDRSQGVDEV